MKLFARYLFRSFFTAACYFLIGQLLWPDNHSSTASFRYAMFFGMIWQAPSLLRERLGLGEDDPFPPLVYFSLAGAVFLLMVAWLIRTTPPFPTGSGRWVLLILSALFLWAVGCGLHVRRRQQGS